jgi:hypothetical protein
LLKEQLKQCPIWGIASKATNRDHYYDHAALPYGCQNSLYNEALNNLGSVWKALILGAAALKTA